jgi:hypothetical protein
LYQKLALWFFTKQFKQQLLLKISRKLYVGGYQIVPKSVIYFLKAPVDVFYELQNKENKIGT